MENENFDADLNNRIKQIFENYDDGRATEGWNLLRGKYPQKNRHKYFFWWIAAISSITFLLIWFFQFETDQPKGVKNVKKSKGDFTKMPAEVHTYSKKTTVETDSFDTNQAEKVTVKTVSDFHSARKSIQRQASVVHQSHAESTQKFYPSNAVFIDIKSDSTDDANFQTQVFKPAKIDSIHQEKSQVRTQKQDSIINSVPKKDLVKTVFSKKTPQKTSRFGFSLFAGPQLNFANGSNTSFGFGAGITTDFQLSKKLKLASGLGLIQNNLSYQNKANNNNAYASVPANQITNPSGSTLVNSTSLKSLDASLLQLDVPVNLVYQILPGKNSIAILAGLSSGIFAKETYQYRYANAANNSKRSKSFQSFYLLKTLNVAVQFGLPVKKYNLQVEPFVKVPLGNVSAQQLKFGAVGINLRFNFRR